MIESTGSALPRTARRQGISCYTWEMVARHDKYKRLKMDLRNKQICRLAVTGFSTKEIAYVYGLSRQRVTDILKQYRPYYLWLSEELDREFIRRAAIVRLRKAGVI